LPIYEEHREAMKGTVGDLRNISNIGRNCGSITASAFLENFVDEKPWCHIDIAGTAHNDKDGGTGFGVRLLIQALA
jgi:leucyl aminopeptidase